MKYFFKLAVAYQIIIWLITAYGFISGIFTSILPNKDAVSLIGSLTVIISSVVVIYSNFYLLFGTKSVVYLKCLQFNKWLNLIQSINLSILGASFYLLIGFQTLGYYVYDTSQRLSFVYGFFKLKLNCSYAESGIIFVGINFIPCILYMIFSSVERKKQELTTELSSKKLITT